MYDEHTSPRERLKQLHGRQKWEYIWGYYKIPILFGITLLLLFIFMLQRQLTKKEEILYVAAINVAVSEDLEKQLTEGFVNAAFDEPQKKEVYFYRDLYLSDSVSADAQYTAASRMKILASINAQALDVVIVSKEVLDAFAEQDYLTASYDISDFPCIRAVGYTEPVYLGVLANSPREQNVQDYLQYLRFS